MAPFLEFLHGLADDEPDRVPIQAGLATPALGGVLGTTHGGEIPFVFDNYRLTPMAGDRPENAEVARTISEAFVHFAQEGDPSHASMPAGSPDSLGERAPMVFNATSRAENDPRPLYAEICARS